MTIDHVGIAVRSLDAAIEHWTRVFGYRQMTNVVVNRRQKVKVVFLTKPGSLTVKLIEPTDSSSPVYRFAMRGGGLHHLCFKCANVDAQLERLKELGVRVLAEPQPGEAFENEKIAFIFTQQGLNIELIDTEKRAARVGDKS